MQTLVMADGDKILFNFNGDRMQLFDLSIQKLTIGLFDNLTCLILQDNLFCYETIML